MAGLFQRLQDQQRRIVEISLDGEQLGVLEGDTLLTAILGHRRHLRLHEIGGEPRAGFCLMGACQDCWVADTAGNRLRACTTYVQPGMAIVTSVAPLASALVAAAESPKASTASTAAEDGTADSAEDEGWA